MRKQFFQVAFLFLATTSLFISSQVQAGICYLRNTGNWSNSSIWDCTNPGTIPTSSDGVQVQNSYTVTLDQNVTVPYIYIQTGGIVDAGSYTITVTSNTVPLSAAASSGSTFNPGTSTVKFSDADHRIITNLSFYNLQWATAITAPRTIKFDGTITIVSGGSFGLDGTAANKVTFTGGGTVSPAVNLSNCINDPVSPVTGITCPAPPPPPISASVESGMALALTFVGVMLIAAFKSRKARKT